MSQTPRYFGSDTVQSPVTLIEGVSSWQELREKVLLKTIELRVTRDEYDALDKTKKFYYKNVFSIQPGEYPSSPCERHKELITRCNLVIIDIDDHADAARILAEKVYPDDLNFILYQTISSRPGARRLRLVVDAEPFPPEEYPRAVQCLADRLGLKEITMESRNCNQPMFTMVTWKGSSKSPLVAHPAEDKGPLKRSEFQDYPLPDEPAFRDYTLKDEYDYDLENLPKPAYTIELVQSMLDKLDPDMDRLSWVKVCAAIKHQFRGSKEAFKMWSEWSEKGVKYEDHTILPVWRSYRGRHNHPATIFTVRWMAKKAGWKLPQAMAENIFAGFQARIAEAQNAVALSAFIDEIAEHPLLDEVLEESLVNALQKRSEELKDPIRASVLRKRLKSSHKELVEQKKLPSSNVPEWCMDVVYLAAQNVYMDTVSMIPYKPEAFNRMWAKECDDAGIKETPEYYALKRACISKAYNTRYSPSNPKNRLFAESGVNFLNSYRATYIPESSDRAEEAERIARFHLDNVICSAPEETMQLWWWMAFIVQNPGVKIKWAPYITGGQGTGKSVIGSWLTAVLGHTNVNILNNDKIAQSYIDWVKDCQLVVAEEVNVSGQRTSVLDKLKPIVTEPRIAITEKYEKSSTIENLINLIFFSNHIAGLPITDDDRRFFVICVKARSHKEVKAQYGENYYDKPHSLAQDPSLAAGLRYALLNTPIPDKVFNHLGTAPETPHRARVLKESASEIRKSIDDLIEGDMCPYVSDKVICVNWALKKIKEIDGVSWKNITIHTVKREAEKMGYIDSGLRPTIAYTKQWLFLKDWGENDGCPKEYVRERVKRIEALCGQMKADESFEIIDTETQI